MKMEYTIVKNSSHPNDIGMDEIDVIFTDFEQAKEHLTEIESSTPNADEKFKIVCRQVMDWCEILMKG